MGRLITATAAVFLALTAAASADTRLLTGAPAPKLARTVVVRATDGRVTVKPRGRRRFVLVRPTTIPMHSVVDATHGKVKLITAKPHGGTQSGVFSEGAFVVTQRKSDGLTDLTLSGGDFSVCNKAAAAGKPITEAKRNRRRRLFGRAHGRFRSRGRSSSATVKGTDWLTEDRCNGTVTQNKSKSATSKVDTATHGRLHFELDPGQTITYYCNVLAITPSTYCLILLAQPADGLIAGGILTTVQTPDYDLCVQAPDGQEGCERNLPLTAPDESGFRQAIFACPVRQVGRYVFAWSLDHKNLLFPSLALSLAKVGPNVDCEFRPPRPAAPPTT